MSSDRVLLFEREPMTQELFRNEAKQMNQTAPGPSVLDAEDPLNPEQAASLLATVNVIRDPLHGDILITALERRLVETPEFQRLYRVKQLAMVDLVFPGATHTRFLHSLGVLHVCSEMI